MATNLSLDPRLIEQAVKVGGERTSESFDYKSERSRR